MNYIQIASMWHRRQTSDRRCMPIDERLEQSGHSAWQYDGASQGIYLEAVGMRGVDVRVEWCVVGGCCVVFFHCFGSATAANSKCGQLHSISPTFNPIQLPFSRIVLHSISQHSRGSITKLTPSPTLSPRACQSTTSQTTAMLNAW